MSLTKVTYSMINKAPVSVLDFGAVGDGVANDTAAIQAAIDTGAKSVYFPQGTYLISSSLKITDSERNFFGDGGLKSSPVIQASTNTFPIFTAEGTSPRSLLSFSNLTLRYGEYGFVSNVTPSGGVGILDRTSFVNVTFDRQTVGGIYGGTTQKMIIGKIENCLFSYCVSGVTSLGGNFSIWAIDNNKFEGLNNSALYIYNVNDGQYSGSVINVRNNRFEANDGITTGYYYCDFRSTENLNFEGNFFEDVNSSIMRIYGLYNFSINTRIVGNFFGVSGGSNILVDDGVVGLSIEYNDFLTGNITRLAAPGATVSRVSIFQNQALGSIVNFLPGDIINCDRQLSWTPAIRPDGTGTAWTATSTGFYNVSNGTITARGSIAYTVKTGTTQYAYLVGLPKPTNSTFPMFGVSINGDTNIYSLAVSSTTGYGAFYKNNSSGVPGGLIGSELGPSTGTIEFQITYSIF
jgi:hypothetical protein